jgi:hypothetical protein
VAGYTVDAVTLVRRVGMARHDVPEDGLAGHVLDPSAREDLVARLAGYVVPVRSAKSQSPFCRSIT